MGTNVRKIHNSRNFRQNLHQNKCKFFRKYFIKNLSIFSMHLCVMDIWEEVHLYAIKIDDEKFFLPTMGTGS